MTLLRDESLPLGALPPNPRDLSHSGQNDLRRRLTPPPAIPAAESALRLRPRSALSSAQVLPEWTISTSPCNDFLSNGDYPLNFVSHSRGSLHFNIASAGTSTWEMRFCRVLKEPFHGLIFFRKSSDDANTRCVCVTYDVGC